MLDHISAVAPVAIVLGLGVAAGMTRSAHLTLLLGLSLGAALLGALLKGLLWACVRPCHRAGVCGSCEDPLSRLLSGAVGTNPMLRSGMPSGHALVCATVLSYAVAWYAAGRTRRSGCATALLVVAGVLFVALCAQRVLSGCHSVPQVSVGTALGVVLGLGGYAVGGHALARSRTA